MMFQSIGDVGQECGNDGYELAVSDEELEQIQEHIHDNPGKFSLSVYSTDEETLQTYIENWQQPTEH